MYHYSFHNAFDKGLEEVENIYDKNQDLITEGLRGKNYANLPLRPPELMELSIRSVAESGKKFATKVSIERIEGRFIHKVYSILFQEALNFINSERPIPELVKIYEHLLSIRDKSLDISKLLKEDSLLKSDTEELVEKLHIHIYDNQTDNLKNKIIQGFNSLIKKKDIKIKYSVEFQKIISDMNKIWNYEALLLSARILFQISNSHKEDEGNIHMSKADIVDYSIPFLVEHEIDGTLIGLSGRSRMDIFLSKPKRVIIEIKTGEEDFDMASLQIAGYALAHESKSADEINFGCVMHIELSDDIGIPLIKCKTFVISDTLRGTFLLKRDQKMKEIKEKKDKEKV